MEENLSNIVKKMSIIPSFMSIIGRSVQIRGDEPMQEKTP
ncbi:hypothetical protein B4135_0470 [Caldibacillus debilis]|uniref:Uncharacterized protein n=1 Tax=Caldibacillus debilis TaxID=301148 RepID=A0A150L8X7_9BACI|nr:hypothetical protein B4135_0470 [Caldibacillus debilis]